MDRDIPYNLEIFQPQTIWKQLIERHQRQKKAKAQDFLWWNGPELVWSLKLVNQHQKVKLARSLPILLELLQNQELIRSAQKFSSFQTDDLIELMNWRQVIWMSKESELGFWWLNTTNSKTRLEPNFGNMYSWVGNCTYNLLQYFDEWQMKYESTCYYHL